MTTSLHSGSQPSSGALWEVHNQLEQIVGSNIAPHGWSVVSDDLGATVTISVPQFTLIIPHTVYWRSDVSFPFRSVSFLVE